MLLCTAFFVVQELLTGENKLVRAVTVHAAAGDAKRPTVNVETIFQFGVIYWFL